MGKTKQQNKTKKQAVVSIALVYLKSQEGQKNMVTVVAYLAVNETVSDRRQREGESSE